MIIVQCDGTEMTLISHEINFLVHEQEQELAVSGVRIIIMMIRRSKQEQKQEQESQKEGGDKNFERF
jgi:hypothetical protein